MKLPKYVHACLNRKSGRVYFYLRRSGFPRVRFPDLPWSPSFMAAYESAMSGPRNAIGAGRIKAGSVAAVIAEYFDSQQFFTSKRPGTQRMRRGILERFRAAYGERPFASLPGGMDRSATRHQAAARGALLARDLTLALPVCGQAPLPAHGSDGKHQAHVHQRRRIPHVDRRRDRAIRGASSYRHEATRCARALALHRTATPVHMGRQHIKGGVLTVKQEKTGVTLAIPVHPHLQAVLDATPSEHLTFLVTTTGKPYSGNHLSESFREWCDAAGLPQRCKPLGLRKAACRRLAEAGCSANEIMAMSGHATMKELVRYTKAADQARLARNALAKAVIR